MKVVVVASQTRGGGKSPFFADGNGNYPVLLATVDGVRLPEGGLVSGTTAKSLGLVNHGTYMMVITPYQAVSKKDGKTYTNYRHEVLRCLDDVIAEALVSDMKSVWSVGKTTSVSLGKEYLAAKEAAEALTDEDAREAAIIALSGLQLNRTEKADLVTLKNQYEIVG